MQRITELQNKVEQTLAEQAFANSPMGLYEPIDYIMGIGGKRIRPVLCLAACELFNDDISQALQPALGFEIFHNFTLLHDDVMDNALVRRNQPTVHIKWDTNTAILSGDAMLIKAYQYIAKLPAPLLSAILPLFNQTALEVCEGQQYDMEFEKRDDVSIDEYIEMIRLKTAVLLAASLKGGALIGGANETQAQLLYQFGINIGIGFQLQDDYLDSFGDTESFGKAIGGDILANKKTFLLINALQLSSGKTHNQLKDWIQKDLFDAEEKIKSVKSIYQEVGVEELIKNKMIYYYEEGMKALEQVNGDEKIKIELAGFALKLIERIR